MHHTIQRLWAIFIVMVGFMIGALGVSSVSNTATAHESRPLQIEVIHLAGGKLSVMWRIPVTVAPDNYPSVTLLGCDLIKEKLFGFAARKRAMSPLKKDHYQCYNVSETIENNELDVGFDLRELKLAWSYPDYNPVLSTMVVYTDHNTLLYNNLFGPEINNTPLAQVAGNGRQVEEYIRLGVDHIWMGYDHLLLVLSLIIIAGTFKRLLWVITGFTIAHSITLIMAALDVVQFAVPPVEAVIALSIILLARELVVNDRKTITWRYPVAVSGILGLLHGFGFAAVLGDIGLPYDDKITALLMFNVGVEIGQLIFVAAFVGFLFGLNRLIKLGHNSHITLVALQRPLGYGVGIIASFWFIDRVVSFI